MDEVSGMERATESLFARALMRFGVPLLLGVLGWFLNDKLTSVQDELRELKTASQSQSRELQLTAADMRVLSTRVDLALTNQVQSLERRVESLERMQTARVRAGEN